MTKCECVPGHFLCLEAVRLWDMVNAAYHNHDETGYELAKQAYNQHIDEVEQWYSEKRNICVKFH